VIAIIVAVSLLLWMTGLPVWMNTASAASLASVSDRLSDSDLSVSANHTIKFTTQSAIDASSTIVITFDSNFGTASFANTDANDYDIATSTADIVVNANGGCAASGNTEFEISSITSDVFTFTHCNGTNALPASTVVTIEIGTNATFGATGDTQITNPASANSYKNTVTAPAADSADFQVAIIDDVTVTATVDTNLTFTIAGVTDGAAINGDAVNSSTTGASATALAFNTLVVDTAEVMGQELTVATNAKNGFTVTLFFDQALTNTAGDTIDFFKDNSQTASSTAWASPAKTLDTVTTYGHMGFTSDDSDIGTNQGATKDFGTALYAGDGLAADGSRHVVLDHTGPSLATVQDKGKARVGFKIEITSLQEAGNSYTAQLTYVVTPTF